MAMTHKLTEEQMAEGRAKAKHNRRWYKQTLLAIAKGELEIEPVQLAAMKEYANQMGWVGPKRKVQALRDKPAYKPKPVLTEELISRLNVVQMPQLNASDATKASYEA